MGGGGFNTAPVPAASYIAAPAMLMDEAQTEEGVTLKMLMAFGMRWVFEGVFFIEWSYTRPGWR